MANKLEIKDLITTGIFTAIYFVLVFACFLTGYVPFFIPLLGLITPIICGIPFMLYVTKIKKFGMITITGILAGLFFMLMGGGTVIFIFGIVFGFFGDLLMKKGNYKNGKYTSLGYSVFSLWIIGFIIRIFATRTEYFESIASSYGEEYVNTLMSITPNWMLPVMCLLTLLGGLAGAKLGKVVLKKHFEKAGV